MIQAFWLDARDKPGLLVHLMKALVGNAHIAFQGNLSHCDFSGLPGAIHAEIPPLRKIDGPDEGEFIVLPLEPDTIKPILEQVLPAGRIVHEIEHIQIEKNGELEFLAGDNFHNECISVGPGVSESLLKELVGNGVLRGYKQIEKDR